MAALTRIGYGQVEPNHLSAKRNGQIYAQLPCADGINVLENGMFLKYDYENGVATHATGVEGEWLLVYNEEKLYDERKQMHRDFAMINEAYVEYGEDPTNYGRPAHRPGLDDGVPATGSYNRIVPRLFKTNVGDIYTTNMANIADIDAAVGTKLCPKAGTGVLEAAGSGAEMEWKVVAVTTMPDGQKAVKLQRVK